MSSMGRAGAHGRIKDAAGADDDASRAGDQDGIAWDFGGGTSDVCVFVLEVDLGDDGCADAECGEINLVFILEFSRAEGAGEGFGDIDGAALPDHAAGFVTQS